VRNPERLDKFYEEMAKIHKDYFSDWRFGQLCSNFFGWLYQVHKVDLFFPEESRMLEYLKEYAESTREPLHMRSRLDPPLEG